MQNQPVLIHCSAGSIENAEQIAKELIHEHLAACVQISPISSVYRWQGVVNHEPEFSLQIKTSSQHVREVEKLIKRLHTYDLPEMIVVPIIDGSPEYLGWLHDSVR